MGIQSKTDRVIWLDLLRVIACIMVITVHASSNYFFNYANSTNHFWGDIYGSLSRACVPLFVAISGALLLPMTLSSTEFIKRRFSRIFFPFLIWSLVYIVINYISYGLHTSYLISDIIKLPFRFSENGLHLWYLYVLLGLYLFVPIISPWIEKASKRDKLIFITIWLFTMLIPFVKKVYQQPFGEASWNDFGTFYYFSGYLGYLVLGHLLYTTHVLNRKLGFIIWPMLFVFGFMLTFGGQHYIYTHKGGFSYQIWGFTTINVAFMVIAVFLFVKNIQIKYQAITNVIIEISDKSFGIFLVHYFIVYKLHDFIYPMGFSPAIIIPANTIVTLGLSYGIAKIISFIPGKKYIIG